MSRLPTVYISHGSPMMAIEPQPARTFLEGFGNALPRPEAILIASAHWLTPSPAVGGAEVLETIHDFGGFPAPLYEMTYPAAGAPEVAARAAALLEDAGIAPAIDGTRGLDHGAWVPLMLMYPDADIPIAQVSIQMHLGPAHHAAIGAALAPLRDEGVLIVGSGNLTHNLRMLGQRTAEAAPFGWAEAFTEWVHWAIMRGEWEKLLMYEMHAPEPRRNHPTDEHFLPLYIAMGAAGRDARPERVHTSYLDGALSMDSYVFN